jgi:hypothetical protein
VWRSKTDVLLQPDYAERLIDERYLSLERPKNALRQLLAGALGQEQDKTQNKQQATTSKQTAPDAKFTF